MSRSKTKINRWVGEKLYLQANAQRKAAPTIDNGSDIEMVPFYLEADEPGIEDVCLDDCHFCDADDLYLEDMLATYGKDSERYPSAYRM